MYIYVFVCVCVCVYLWVCMGLYIEHGVILRN